MNFGQAIFGYTTFNMFTILPTPPGQVGSNEAIGTLVFGGLLGFNKTGVLAMFVFSHPLTALIMFTLAMISLASLGLNLSSALKAPSTEEGRKAFLESQKYMAIMTHGY
jgi:RsiW-degrading membrane proteinase PrsW (M82 family)